MVSGGTQHLERNALPPRSLLDEEAGDRPYWSVVVALTCPGNPIFAAQVPHHALTATPFSHNFCKTRPIGRTHFNLHQKNHGILKGSFAQADEALREFLCAVTCKTVYPNVDKLYWTVNSGINALTVNAPLTDLVRTDSGADS